MKRDARRWLELHRARGVTPAGFPPRRGGRPLRRGSRAAAWMALLVSLCVFAPIGLGTDQPTSTVSGTVWTDLDRDGAMDVGEPAHTGLAVALVRDGAEARLTLTDGSGRYRFESVPVGEGYAVRVTTDTGESIVQRMLQSAFFALEAANDLTVDLAVDVPATFEVIAFLDANRNGSADVGERGVAGVVVRFESTAESTPQVATDFSGHGKASNAVSGRQYAVGISAPPGYGSLVPTRKNVVAPTQGLPYVLLVPLVLTKRETNVTGLGSLVVVQRWPVLMRPGSTVEGEIEVRSGPVAVDDVRLSASLSGDLHPAAGVGRVGAARGWVQMRLGRLPANARRRVKIRVHVGARAGRTQRSLVRVWTPGGLSAMAFARVRVAPAPSVR